ncbi:aminoacyl-tRNA hydrolase [Patescibacteria group bacterium]|nr:aminoacyl-tRNA hydrolase [Patescibacteria group bacterium]
MKRKRGKNNMKLIIGLGNPGRKYKKTKHNFGFLVLDKLAGKNKWTSSKNANAEYLRLDIALTDTELLKPQTYMNNSGIAVAYAVKKHNIKPEDIIVIYDDLDLEFGNMRIGKFESAAGHNGIKSIIQELGFNNFIRIRLGINDEYAEKIPAEKFVLNKFPRKDKKQLEEIIDKAVNAVTELLETDIETVMNKYN